ncbi:MAG: T9SS type A sorting domain-containing protein [Bacteroidota bacterium]|nr:T9SS type A sorting domain-containing protein [Bacteroidota bacterium]
MRKTLLILFALHAVFMVRAQEAQKAPEHPLLQTPAADGSMISPVRLDLNYALNKSVTVSTWYSFPNALASTGTMGGFAPYMLPDSFVWYGTRPDTLSPYDELSNVFINGVGAVFNPREELFDIDDDPETVTFTTDNNYTLDSVAIRGVYQRPNEFYYDEDSNQVAVRDTLYVHVIGNTDVGRWLNTNPSGDTIANWGTVEYNRFTNFPVKWARVMKIPLTQERSSDQFQIFSTALLDASGNPSPLELSGTHITAAIFTFKPGTPYTKSTDTLMWDTIAGTWNTPTGGPSIFRPRILFDQDVRDLLTHNNGLLMHSIQRYKTTWWLNTTPAVGPRYLPSRIWTNPQYPDVHFNVSSTNIGIDENGNQDLGISVYPNPSESLVSVNFTLAENSNVNVNVTNMLGQVVQVETLANATAGQQNLQFDVSNLEAGVYFINIVVNGATQTQKFVVR